MTVRELLALNVDETNEIYVQENGETTAAFMQAYMDCVKDEILDAEAVGFQVGITPDGDSYICIFTQKTEVNEDGAG